jgi:hypothetical protein
MNILDVIFEKHDVLEIGLCLGETQTRFIY